MKAIAEKYRPRRVLALLLALSCLLAAPPARMGSAETAPVGPLRKTVSYRQGEYKNEQWTDEAGAPALNAMGYCYKEAALNGRSLPTETNYFDTAHRLVNCIYGYSTWRAAYDGLGNQNEIQYFNAQGEPVNCQYGYARRVNTYQTANGKRKLKMVEYFDRYGDPVVVPGRYAKMVNTYSEPKLRLLGTAYYGADGLPMRCPGGYAAVKYERSSNARVEAERYYDTDGSLMIAPALGYAEKLQTYDAGDCVTSVTYRDETGALTLGPEGYAYAEFDLNRRKECLEERYYGTDGQPVLLADGYAVIRRKYRASSSQLLWEAYFDGEGSPVVHRTLGYHKLHNTYKDAISQVVERRYDEAGNLALASDGYAMRAQLKSDGQVVRETYYDTEEKAFIPPEIGYARVRRVYKMISDRYRLAEESFYDGDDQPMVVESLGYAARRNTFDGKGRAIARVYLDEAGRVTLCADGYAKVENAYNSKNRIVSQAYLDAAGKAVGGASGFAKVEREYDGDDHLLREGYYDTAHRLCVGPKGYALLCRQYDEEGNVILESYYDAAGQPCLCASGYAAVRKDYNIDKKVTALRYLNTAGELTLVSGGYAAYQSSCGADGRIDAVTYYGADGLPKLIREGYASLMRGYDPAGNVAWEAYFDASALPVTIKAGYAKISRLYDRKGRALQERYLDAEGMPAVCQNGYAVVQKDYDESGRLIRERYYDGAGKPAPNSMGICAVAREYAADGLSRTDFYFGADGLPALCQNGYAAVVKTFDENRNTVAERYLDAEGAPALRTDINAYAFRRAYNDKKQVTEESYFDGDGSPMPGVNGYAKVLKAYDDKGNVNEEQYFGTDGLPAARGDVGVYARRRVYDGSKRVVEESYFDGSGNPMAGANGYAKVLKEYDDKGNVAAEAYFGPDGLPALRKDTKVYAFRRVYNDKKQRIQESFYDGDGNPMLGVNGYSKVLKEYDEKGNVAAEKYFGTDGAPVARKDTKVYAFRRVYNDKKQITEESYYDGSGALMLGTNGYAKVLKEYDENGNAAFEQYFGADGLPVARKDTKVYAFRRVYNDKKQITEESYYDGSGALMLGANGYAKVIKEYDENGNAAYEQYFGTDGLPIARSDIKAYARRRVYDDQKQVIEEIFYDGSGALMLGANGYAKVLKEYDDKGNATYEQYFGTDGLPIARSDIKAYARRRVYDSSKRVVEESFYDGSGAPMANALGYARIVKEYDERGSTVGEAYFGPDGAPAARKDTKVYAFRRVYNDKKQLIEESYYDGSGQPMLCAKGYARLTKTYGADGQVTEKRYDLSGGLVQ